MKTIKIEIKWAIIFFNYGIALDGAGKVMRAAQHLH